MLHLSTISYKLLAIDYQLTYHFYVIFTKQSLLSSYNSNTNYNDIYFRMHEVLF